MLYGVSLSNSVVCVLLCYINYRKEVKKKDERVNQYNTHTHTKLATSSQAPNRRRFNDYPFARSTQQVIGCGNGVRPRQLGEDIVCTHMKV